MDYQKFVQFHIDNEADITVAVQPAGWDTATELGILKLDSNNRIVNFQEKPKLDELPNLESWEGAEKPFMGSMGIYVFNTDVLIDILSKGGNDFGKDIIPSSMRTHRLMGYVFEGFWEDIGTIRRFFQVNLEMATPSAPFDFYAPNTPIYTRARFLPTTEVWDAQLHHVLLTDGCRIYGADISNSVVGVRSLIGPEATIRSTVMMGSDYYETDEEKMENRLLGRPDVGIGTRTFVEQAIVDKNARIGKNVTIRALEYRPDEDRGNWVARDGIVIVPKGAIIPDGSVI